MQFLLRNNKCNLFLLYTYCNCQCNNKGNYGNRVVAIPHASLYLAMAICRLTANKVGTRGFTIIVKYPLWGVFYVKLKVRNKNCQPLCATGNPLQPHYLPANCRNFCYMFFCRLARGVVGLSVRYFWHIRICVYARGADPPHPRYLHLPPKLIRE
jgi:hypothetical protein